MSLQIMMSKPIDLLLTISLFGLGAVSIIHAIRIRPIDQSTLSGPVVLPTQGSFETEYERYLFFMFAAIVCIVSGCLMFYFRLLAPMSKAISTVPIVGDIMDATGSAVGSVVSFRKSPTKKRAAKRAVGKRSKKH